MEPKVLGSAGCENLCESEADWQIGLRVSNNDKGPESLSLLNGFSNTGYVGRGH